MEKQSIKSINEVRKLSMYIIYEVTEHKAYTNIALEKILRDAKLSHIDKRLVTEIVNGTVRMLKHLDWVLNLFLVERIDKLNPWIKTILRLTLYQILFMDKIPSYASVNDAVELARKKTNKKLSGLVNGVLRNILRNLDNISYPDKNTPGYLAVFYSHPQWIVEDLLNNYGWDTTEKILQYNNQRPDLYLRVNTLKITREKLITELRKTGIECEASLLSPWGIKISRMEKSLDRTAAYENGYFYIQNTASMLAASIVNPEPHSTVYDLCSGVGGKASHIAQLMNNQGRIYCYDIYRQKLSLLERNIKRLGVNIITTCLSDVLNINESDSADAVLLDAPCSGLGVLNRRADLRWNKSKNDLIELQNLQKALLQRAGQLVKEGGILLYATCTINKAENEEIIESFLDNSSEFFLEGFADRISYFPLDVNDKNDAQKGMLTIFPGKYQTDGMFYALLKRKGAS